ncbi:MAG TPA: BON domain-containing protein [Pyrinomonadaceae bacterium]|nr:BON domain-containing protein [Pyrinomonadaceae bacterium]
MAYDDEQAKRSRVVVETPTSRREVTQTESVRNDRGGMSGATVGVIVVVAIALITVVVLFLMNGQQTDTANANLAAQQQAQQPPVIVQQPAAQQQQPPVIIQQPAPAANQPPVIINQPAPAGGSAPANTSDDGAVQTAIDKKISDDPTLSALGITATVLDGKVTLTGTVKSEAQKSQVDRAIRATRGVKQVDNQIVVLS